MTVAIALAYYNTATISAVKSFIVQAAGVLYHKTFYRYNLFRTVVSQSVCHCQSLSPQSNICWQGWLVEQQSPTRIGSSLAQKYLNRWKLNDSVKHSSLFCMVLVMDVKSFVLQASYSYITLFLSLLTFPIISQTVFPCLKVSSNLKFVCRLIRLTLVLRSFLALIGRKNLSKEQTLQLIFARTIITTKSNFIMKAPVTNVTKLLQP